MGYIYIWNINGILLAGWWFQPTPLKNDGVSSSVGMMTFPTEWKNKIHVPNHQPGRNWPSVSLAQIGMKSP